MAFEHKEGQGTINIGGITYEIAAWEKKSQRGGSFFSLQASLPREKSEGAPAPQFPKSTPADAPSFQQMPPMPSEEFDHLWKQTKFADFEREASFNALSKEEKARIEEQLSDSFYERISVPLFDASIEDDNDEGLIDAAVYKENLDRLTELVKLKACGQMTEEEYNKLKLPLLEAMYEQLKD